MARSSAFYAAIVAALLLSLPARLFAMEGVEEYVAQQNRAASSGFGSLIVHGPMTVDGNLFVGGELDVHGPMTAGRMTQVRRARCRARLS